MDQAGNYYWIKYPDEDWVNAKTFEIHFFGPNAPTGEPWVNNTATTDVHRAIWGIIVRGKPFR